MSAYTLATGAAYTDATLQECSRARGRQNEPAIAIDPRDPMVILGSSNDYCGVYNQTDASRVFRENDRIETRDTASTASPISTAS